MDFTLNLAIIKWFSIFAFSCFLWVVPVSIGAPNLIVFLSLLSSVFGFVCSSLLCDDLKQEEKRKKKRLLQHEEIENYSLALEEESIKRELVFQFNPDLLFQCSEHEHETLNPLPANVSSSIESDVSTTAEQAVYTKLKLTHDELVDLLPRLKQTMGKIKILEDVWGVKRGGSVAYKKACEEFDYFSNLSEN